MESNKKIYPFTSKFLPNGGNGLGRSLRRNYKTIGETILWVGKSNSKGELIKQLMKELRDYIVI
jgi:hypothetical protein